MVSSVVIDVDSLTLLRERLDDVWLPTGFASGWDAYDLAVSLADGACCVPLPAPDSTWVRWR